MYIIDTEIEKVCEEFSQVEKWIKTIHKKVLKTEIDHSKIQTYYSYGFFVTKPKEGEVVLTNEDIFKLKFKKRLKLELSKVRVDITIKIGNFTMTNPLEKGIIPDDIKNIVTNLINLIA